MNWYLTVLKNYTLFNGRARRSEYWYFALFNMIIYVVLALIGSVIHFPMIASIYSLAVLVPGIAVGIRRMHDVDKSGWYLLIPIYNLVLACTDGTNGDNQYGPDPKGRTAFGSTDYEKPFDINQEA
jgi:uncharacterized membrane protein YhaH (DUF805 family)